MSRFEPARLAFAQLADALGEQRDLRGDVERAFEFLLSRYDTKIYENRFIVGGVTERIIGATFVAMGRKFSNIGVRSTALDLSIDGTPLSVKGSFKPGHKDIRMVNVMGNSAAAAWEQATVFVIANVGIGYADPDLLTRATTRAKDAVILKTSKLLEFWEKNPKYLAKIQIPFSRSDIHGSDVASRVVADEILRYGMKRLKPLDTRTPEQ
jgi:hypothetical protein